jgi:hypothetical protein
MHKHFLGWTEQPRLFDAGLVCSKTSLKEAPNVRQVCRIYRSGNA